MGEKLFESLALFPIEWKIFILSAVPITELRVTIPLAIGLGLEPTIVLAYALMGNFMPILPLLFGLPYALRIIERFPLFNRFALKVLSRTRGKSQLLHKYGVLGLILLVSIPLPGTGVWTGSLAAFLIGMPIKKALPAITIGMIIAGVIVMLVSTGFFKIFELFDLITWLIFFIFFLIYITVKKKKQTKK